jgi:acid phosphatase
MRRRVVFCGVLVALGIVARVASLTTIGAQTPPDLSVIDTIVVIYSENRSFDAVYGVFPGADGLAAAGPAAPQIDRDGSRLKELPPIWRGLTAASITPAVTEADTAHLANAPFSIDDASGFKVPANVVTRDLVHRFYQNVMQIHGGKNDSFVAYGDSGALVMGHYDGSKLPLWQVARQYTLTDHFFQGTFGGSFLNHLYLVCGCIPIYPHADQSPAKGSIVAMAPDGVGLALAPDSPKSALDGPPKFLHDGNLTPDFYAVNTMQPPYQPSTVKPAVGGDPAYADPANPVTLPPQTMATIGDQLSQKGISWAWYAGGWAQTLESGRQIAAFQFHHQSFNYFASFAPGTPARAQHLKDAGLSAIHLIEAIDAGTLPHVVFYKPQGTLNQHPGYTDLLSGDQHIADLISHLEKSPQWAHMVVVITYDENGGQWDHVAPPIGDRWGPGSRVPTIIVSPLAKKGFVDHTPYDTASILRLIAARYGLPTLPGIETRDKALAAHGVKLGDLTAALTLPAR